MTRIRPDCLVNDGWVTQLTAIHADHSVLGWLLPGGRVASAARMLKLTRKLRVADLAWLGVGSGSWLSPQGNPVLPPVARSRIPALA